MQEAAKDALHLGGHKLFALRQLKQHSMPGKGYFAHPQVISLHKASGALGRMRMLTQEGPFGPLLALLPVKGWRQALDVMAADKRFGLTAVRPALRHCWVRDSPPQTPTKPPTT